MTIKDCEARVDTIKRRFEEFFNCEIDVAIFLFGKAGIGERRDYLFQLCSEWPGWYLRGTKGEAIFGRTGMAVIMYPFAIDFPGEFDMALCHELGHIFFCCENAELYMRVNSIESIDDEGGMAKLGLALWNECIAQSIANFVLNREPADIPFDKQEQLMAYLYDALPGVNPKKTALAQKQADFLREGFKLIPYSLGLYCAMYLTDPTIACLFEENPNAARGLEDCSEAEENAIFKILTMVDEQLAKEDFWIVDEWWLTQLGELVMRLEQSRVRHR